MQVLVYGLAPTTCDTVKKALQWLALHKQEVMFHDYRKDGLDETLLDEFINKLGWEALLNKRSTSYRSLSDDDKANLNESLAKSIMLRTPAIIKRPLLIHQNTYHLGFKPEQYQRIFSL